MVVGVGGAPQQERSNKRDEQSACDLESGGAAAISESAADDGETGEHQDQGEPDMSQRQNRAVGETFPQLAWLTQVIRDEHGLAVARHQSMDGSEQDGGRHGEEDRQRIAAGDLAKAVGHAVMEPMLEGDE